jgi:hypothetical protein
MLSTGNALNSIGGSATLSMNTSWPGSKALPSASTALNRSTNRGVNRNCRKRAAMRPFSIQQVASQHALVPVTGFHAMHDTHGIETLNRKTNSAGVE